MENNFLIPEKWERQGLVLAKETDGPGSHVVGDPCIVRDETLPGWRMFLFYDPPGHGQAVCAGPDPTRPDAWKLAGPLSFANPQAVLGGSTHKPFVVMDPYRPNQAALIQGRYCLLSISFRDGHKIVQQAWSKSLAGPWELYPEVLIDTGQESDFDAKHVDAVSGYYFEERQEFLYFYMGYPLKPQSRSQSTWGSAQGVAVRKVDEKKVRKLGPILAPAQVFGHWAEGWVGGLQILPGKKHAWIAIVNASPTAPVPNDKTVSREEPPPSLGGFAYCDEPWPVSGWAWDSEPIEWIDGIPAEAVRNGEGVNLWRQHILALQDGRMALFYNSGEYGKEQLYLKVSR